MGCPLIGCASFPLVPRVASCLEAGRPTVLGEPGGERAGHQRGFTIGTRARIQPNRNEDDVSVTPLELFFDLVFVYALTQVTALMAAEGSARGVLNGMIVLAVVWWCWVGFSWLGNSVKADEGWTRAAFVSVMAAVFVAALSIPESFSDIPGGLSGPVVLAVCYGCVRVVHLGFYVVTAVVGRDSGLLLQLARFGAVTALSVVLMVVGAVLGGDAQLVLWLGALVVDYVGTQVIGASGWRLPSPKHFSERHALIVIIALGESIVAIGIGVTEVAISTGVIVASVLGIALAASIWWVYFDVTALAGERRLANAPEEHRPRLARDAYSYIHLPMIAGIVIAALGLKKVLNLVGGVEPGYDWGDSLTGVSLFGLHAGPAIFLVAIVGFRLRMARSLNGARLLAAAALGATIPVGARVGALADLALVSGVMAALIVFEAIQFAEGRRRIRHDHHGAT